MNTIICSAVLVVTRTQGFYSTSTFMFYFFLPVSSTLDLLCQKIKTKKWQMRDRGAQLQWICIPLKVQNKQIDNSLFNHKNKRKTNIMETSNECILHLEIPCSYSHWIKIGPLTFKTVLNYFVKHTPSDQVNDRDWKLHHAVTACNPFPLEYLILVMTILLKYQLENYNCLIYNISV